MSELKVGDKVKVISPYVFDDIIETFLVGKFGIVKEISTWNNITKYFIDFGGKLHGEHYRTHNNGSKMFLTEDHYFWLNPENLEKIVEQLEFEF